jgi:glutathione S-transferase
MARIWIEFANSRLFAATHRMMFAADGAARSQLAAEMAKDVRFLEEQALGRRTDGPYLLGSQFTLADIALHPWFEQAATLERLSAFRMPKDCRRVAEWRAACAARPAVQDCARSDEWYVESYQSYLSIRH